MASEVKADKLSPSGGTALQIGDASDTITIPTGATFTVVDGIGVASGGTGLASYTAGDILYATGTTTLAKLAKGTAEQVLAMNTGATAPDWGSVDLTVLPTITAAKGGTGQTSYTAGDLVYASGTTAVSKLGVGTALQTLQTNSGATAPEWVASPQSLMTAAGDTLYASGANTLARLAKGSDDDVLTLASGVPSWAAAAGGGKMLQVQQYVATAHTVTSTSTSYADITDFEIAITPTAASSKILVNMNFHGSSVSTLVLKMMCDIEGGGYNDIYVGDAEGVRSPASAGTGTGGVGGTLNVQDFNALFLHTPSYSLTDELTYKLQWVAESNPTGMCLNRATGSTNFVYVPVTASSLTVIEVGA